MNYGLKEQWRPIVDSDGLNLEGLVEGYIERLDNGLDLLYVRKHPFPKIELEATHFAKMNEGDEIPTLIARTVEAKIFIGPILECHLLSLGDSGKYLAAAAKELGDLLVYFENVPTQNRFFPAEIETLRGISQLAEKLRTGQCANEDYYPLLYAINKE